MDITKLMEIAHQHHKEKSMLQTWTLGRLIEKFKAFPNSREVYFAFGYLRPTDLSSYRGSYDQLALEFDEKSNAMKVDKFRKLLEDAVGKEFTGYKGGQFLMDLDTPVWVANYGNSGSTAIIDVVDDEYQILIFAAKIPE